MKTKTIPFIIFTLFLVSTAFGASEDFVALANNASMTVPQCSIVENVIKIGNTGNINSLYSISQEGKAAKWSIVRPRTLSLDEGKTRTIMSPVNIPCDAKKGEYELITYIETAFGLKKAIKQEIIVEKQVIVEVPEPEVNETEEEPEEVEGWDNIEIEIEKIKEVCGCENKTYEITIKADQPESVQTSIEGPEWAKLSTLAAIDAEENSEYTIELILQACNVTGEHIINITTKSINSSNTAVNVIEIEAEQECKTTAVKVLKVLIYVLGASIIIILILIAVLYIMSEREKVEEPELEEIKRPVKKPKERKISRVVLAKKAPKKAKKKAAKKKSKKKKR